MKVALIGAIGYTDSALPEDLLSHENDNSLMNGDNLSQKPSYCIN